VAIAGATGERRSGPAFPFLTIVAVNPDSHHDPEDVFHRQSAKRDADAYAAGQEDHFADGIHINLTELT
jgi:hypothetical protein